MSPFCSVSLSGVGVSRWRARPAFLPWLHYGPFVLSYLLYSLVITEA